MKKQIHNSRLPRRLPSPRLQSAFSLLELLLVVAIVGILATLAYGSYEEYWEKARVADAKADIFGLDVKLTTYFSINKFFPASLAAIGGAPLDPWGNPYQYLNLQTLVKGKQKPRKDHNLHPINSDFDLYSMGKDGRSVSPLTAQASRDDIIRANNGGFIGLAKDY